MTSRSLFGVLGLFISLLFFLQVARAQNETYVATFNDAGEKIYVAENRQPSLYTQSFGDCLGGSLLEITRFDAAYYEDNSTVVFHLQGNTDYTNQTLMSKSKGSAMATYRIKSI